jgi:hypothetical protein
MKSQCEFLIHAGYGEYGRCTTAAHTMVWSPNWHRQIAEQGPLYLCSAHAELYRVKGILFGHAAVKAFETAFPPELRRERVITAPDYKKPVVMPRPSLTVQDTWERRNGILQRVAVVKVA